MDETPEQQIMQAIIDVRKSRDIKPIKDALEEVLQGCETVMRSLDFKIEMAQNAENYERSEVLSLVDQYYPIMIFYNTMCKLYNMAEIRESKVTI